MSVILGAGLFAGWTILFVLIVLYVRRPDAARWLRSGALQSTIVIVGIGIWAISTAAFMRGLAESTSGAQIADTVAAAAILLGMLVGLYLLHPVRRLRAYEVEAAAPTHIASVSKRSAPRRPVPSSGRRAA